jgi:hypothetical protein
VTVKGWAMRGSGGSRLFAKIRRTALVVGLSIGWTSAIAPPARAADAAEDMLNKEGVEARRRNDDAVAWEIFRRAYDLHQSPRSAAQMGLAEIALGRWTDAELHLEEALRADGDPWVRKNRQVLGASLDRVRNQFGSLQVLGNPSGAEVVVEGAVIGKLPMTSPIRIRTGECRLAVRARGYAEASRTVAITARNPTRETVDLVALTAPTENKTALPEGHVPPSPTNPPPLRIGVAAASDDLKPELQSPFQSKAQAIPTQEGTFRRIALPATVGLALAFLGAGIVEHMIWQNRVSSFGEMPTCDNGLAGRGGAACQQAYDEGQRARTLAFVGYGLAIGFAATAAIVYFNNPPASGGARNVACALTPGLTGLGCRLRF